MFNNTKFRAMRGFIVLATLLGLFITGIEAPLIRRKGKQKEKTSQSEEMWKPLLNRVEGEMMTEEKFELMDLVEEKTATEENSLSKVDFIEGIMADPLLPYNVLIRERATMFFREEQKILEYVESFYQTGEQPSGSSSAAEQLGMPRNEKQKFALVYITYLSFWISVNFRLCSVFFSLYTNYPHDQNIKPACDSHFKVMAFAFSEFQKILDSIGIKFSDERLARAEKYVLHLDLDFVMNEDELKRKQEPADYESHSLIEWNKVPDEIIVHQNVNGIYCKKLYKTNFRNTESFQNRYRQKLDREVCNSPPAMFEFLFNELRSQINSDIFTYLSNILRDWIYGRNHKLKSDVLWSPTWLTSSYKNNKQMWQHVAKDELNIPMNTGKEDCIRRALKLMREVRNVDYSLVFADFLE